MQIQLHEPAIKVFQFCTRNRISLRVEWISQGETGRICRIQGFDDRQVSHEFFLVVDRNISADSLWTDSRITGNENRKCLSQVSFHVICPRDRRRQRVCFRLVRRRTVSKISKVLYHVSLTTSTVVLCCAGMKLCLFLA